MIWQCYWKLPSQNVEKICSEYPTSQPLILSIYTTLSSSSLLFLPLILSIYTTLSSSSLLSLPLILSVYTTLSSSSLLAFTSESYCKSIILSLSYFRPSWIDFAITRSDFRSVKFWKQDKIGYGKIVQSRAELSTGVRIIFLLVFHTEWTGPWTWSAKHTDWYSQIGE